MTKGKVVLVLFPFDDLSTNKVRPAVCLTDPIGPHHHIILAFISSRIPPDLLETDLILDSNRTDFIKTGLHFSSTLRLHRLITVSTSLIRRELGELSSQMQAEVDKNLRKLFGLKEHSKQLLGPLNGPSDQEDQLCGGCNTGSE